jgi:glycosyltransferase involved in cell wall biosynthesis
VATAAAVHVTTELEARDIQRLGLKAVRVDIIPNGIDLPCVGERRAFVTQCSEPVILSIGRLSWKKGLDRLIEAIAHLPRAKLVIAGNDEEGYLNRLKEIASSVGVSNRVHFVGPAYGEDKWRLLAAADVFALPSYSENFGIAVLEAMAAGLPVVVTPEVGLAAEVAACEAGLVADGEPRRFAAALALLLDDPVQRQRMGDNGRTAAATLYSWEAVAARCEGVYHQILEHAPVRRKVIA